MVGTLPAGALPARLRGILIVACATLDLASAAFAGPPALDRLTAGYQAQAVAEDARLGAINGQIQVQDYIRWQAGLPDRWSLYAGGPQRFAPAARPRGALLKWWLWDGVFEPWPEWAGDIYGFRYDNPIEQPSGHLITPTGPNSYIYGPVYDRGLKYPPPGTIYGPLPNEPGLGVERKIEPPVAEPPPAEAVPPGADELELAIAAFRSARYDQAIARLDDLLADFPDHGPALLLRSQAQFASQLFDEAAASLREALRVLPAGQQDLIAANYDDYYERPEAYTGQLRALEAFVRRNPDDADASLLLGYHYGCLGYPREAADRLARAAAAAPNDAQINGLRRRFEEAANQAPPANGPREF
jgi:tetratricopeptide (TPR) repeat protein